MAQSKKGAQAPNAPESDATDADEKQAAAAADATDADEKQAAAAADEGTPNDAGDTGDTGDANTPGVVKKVTVATVYGPVDQSKLPPLFTGSIESPERNPNPYLRVARIAGYASDTKSGVSTFGPWTALVGEFAGTNIETGEIVMGKTCLIPGAMGEALTVSAEELFAKSPGTKMRFSVDIFVKRNAREPLKKYDYMVKPVLAAKLSSPALALLSM